MGKSEGFLKLQRIHLLLHPGAIVVIIDVWQRNDDGTGRPRWPKGLSWSIEIRVFLEILEIDKGFSETESTMRREFLFWLNCLWLNQAHEELGLREFLFSEILGSK